MIENQEYSTAYESNESEYSFELTDELHNLIKEYAKLYDINVEDMLNVVIREAIEFIDKYQNTNSASKLDSTIRDYVEGFGSLEIIMRDNMKLRENNNYLNELIDTLSNENNQLIKKLNEKLNT